MCVYVFVFVYKWLAVCSRKGKSVHLCVCVLMCKCVRLCVYGCFNV